MNDLRISKKRNKYVILNYSDNRKQIGKGVTNKTEAKQLLTQLITDVATKKVVVSNRYKFKDEYKKYAEQRLLSAEDKTVRLSKASIRSFEGYYRNYISDCFPDVYVDEVNGPLLGKFVETVYLKKNNSFSGQSLWKTAKSIISNIKTFLRYADSLDMKVNQSVFNWKMSNQYHLQPEDDNLFYKKETNPINPFEVKKLMDNLYQNRNKNFDAFYQLIAVATFIFTGLRFSELKGILKENVDLVRQTIFIAGVYDHNEGRYKNKTKRKASKREIDIQDDFLPLLKEWMNKIKNINNPYLFPSTKTEGPISCSKFRTMIWTAYEANGLAVLKWKVTDKNNINGKRNPGHRGITKSFTVVSSPFQGCPTKTFRHSLATHLINALKYDKSLDQNYVKNVLGHGDYRTTEGIYGNHVMRVSNEERAERRKAVKKAMKLQIARN